jgi:hypothetical protein
MQNLDIKPVRIYVDHWEDYESIGDRAMLVNALRRLELVLRPCQFVGPLSPEKAGQFSYPGLSTVAPPYQELLATARQLSYLYGRIRKRLPARLAPPELKMTIFLDLAAAVIGVKLFFHAIGLHSVFTPPFRAFLEEIKSCDVFFTVGDCSLSVTGWMGWC